MENDIPMIFSGNSSMSLANEICGHLNIPLESSHPISFADGESYFNPGTTVRGRDCFIIQSTCNPVNDNLMSLLVMIDALRRASARRITAVIPYYGYARQDRKAKGRDPITAKLVANMLTAAGADRILTMDLHVPQIQGFFDIPLDHLVGAPIFAQYYREKFHLNGNATQFVAVSPDVGSVARTRDFAEKLKIDLAIVDKRRPQANVSEVMNIIGSVEGKTCIIMDDMVDTGGSLCNAAKALIEKGGAKDVYACATHGVLSNRAWEKLENSVVREMAFLNTIPLPADYTGSKIRTISVAPVFAKAIRHISEDTSISDCVEF